MKTRKILFLLLLLTISITCFSWERKVKISRIEVSYLPNVLVFFVDGNYGDGAAHNRYIYDGGASGQGAENVKAVYATLLFALSMDRQITIIGEENKPQLIYLD